MNPSPGFSITSRMSFEDYVQIDALNMSRLKKLERSPLHFVDALTRPQTSKPLSLGKAAHAAVLEPDRFRTGFAVWDRLSENGNPCPRKGQYWERFQSDNFNKEIITVEQHDLAIAMQNALRGEPDVMRYLDAGDPEVSLEWALQPPGLRERKCKGRVDWLTPIEGRTLVGLKSADDCREYQFGKAAANYGYALSWAWYHDGFELIAGAPARTVEIVVESKPPHAIAIYTIENDILIEGHERYIELLKLLEECERSGEWPGPTPGERPLSLPSWYYGQQDDLADLGLEGF